MNATLKTIIERYSCRSYTDEPVAKEYLEQIAQAAVASPSAVNRQPWKIVFVTDKELLQEMEQEAVKALKNMGDSTTYDRIMSRGGTVFYNATCMAFILSNPSESDYASMDCGIVAQNIALAATSLDLGNVICGMARLIFMGEKREYFSEKLGMTDGYEFGTSVLIGHTEQKGQPHEVDQKKISFI